MTKLINPMTITLQDNLIQFRYKGDDTITYQMQTNLFEANTGVTIRNPDVNVPAYGIALNQWGTNLDCGHIINTIMGYLKSQDLENIILVVDFSGVTEVSQNFCEQYLKFILATKSKVLSIHQNTNINTAFSLYIESFIDYQDVET